MSFRSTRAWSAKPAALAALAAVWMFGIASAQAVEWSAVAEREVVLLYPGQASWEWVLTASDHSGATKFREGKNCAGCHEGEQADIGATIVGGKKLEASPVAGKPGSLVLKVQTARDAERLYFRLRWKPGAPGGSKMDANTAARVTVMLGDDSVKEAMRAGCWGSCHDDSAGMASAAPGSKTTKYLGASRSKMSRQGGGDNLKPAAELQALLDKGVFLEYWQAKLNPGQPAQAVSGYILDERHASATPSTTAEAQFENGEWTVVLSRALKAAGSGEKDLVAGKTYGLGFAVHDDFSDHRFHHVSLEQTLALDGQADFVAAAQ